MIFALVAGVLLGLFQIFHRKANEGLKKNNFCMIVLLATGLLVIVGVIVVTDARNSIKLLAMDSIFFFSMSGFFNFFLGFNLLNISQRKVGAGITGVLLGTTPVFAAISGLIIFQEHLKFLILLGILIVVAGIVLVSLSRGADRKSLKFSDIIFGLGTALCFSLSPIWVRLGLKTVSSPLIGVGVGMMAALAGFLIIFAFSSIRSRVKPVCPLRSSRWLYEIFAGVFISIATWTRYIALEILPMAVVTTVARLSILVVLVLSPFILSGKAEKRTMGTWLGASLVLGGAAVIALT